MMRDGVFGKLRNQLICHIFCSNVFAVSGAFICTYCNVCILQALLAEQESGTSTKGQTLTEQILQIMETILLEASSQPHDVHKVVGFICFTAHDDFD